MAVLSDTNASYQWRLNNQNLTDGLLTTGACAGATAAGVTSPKLTLLSVPTECEAAKLSVQLSNTVGSVLSQEAVLNVVSYSTAPTNTSTFSAGSAKFGIHTNAPKRAQFKWRLGDVDLVDGIWASGACAGIKISGSSTPSLSLDSVPFACNNASFVARTTIDGAFLDTPAATLQVSEIVAQPSTTLVFPGGTATFNVLTSGASGLQYAWSMNGLLLTNGVLSSGPCKGATVAGAATTSLSLQGVPLSCDGTRITLALKTSSGAIFSSGSSTLYVTGFYSAPAGLILYSGTNANFIALTSGAPTVTSVTWRLNGAVLADGLLTSGACAGASVAGSSNTVGTANNTLSLTNIPLGCNGTSITAILTTNSGSLTSDVASIIVYPGDARNGTYKSFHASGKTMNFTVDFNLNVYHVQPESGQPFSGTMTPDRDPIYRGEQIGTFVLNLVSTSPSSTPIASGALRYKDDVLVGSHQDTLNVAPQPFVAARKFVKSSSELTSSISLKVFGRDVNALTPGLSDSVIYTALIQASGLSICSGSSVYEVANCGDSGGTLATYNLSYNEDSSVTFTNQSAPTDKGIAYIAKMGGEYLYLQAGTDSGRVARLRYGLQSLSTLNATALGPDSGYNWGIVSADGTHFTFSGAGHFGLSSTRNARPLSSVLTSGLFSYGDPIANGSYFATQSSSLIMVLGAKHASSPAINGYLASASCLSEPGSENAYCALQASARWAKKI